MKKMRTILLMLLVTALAFALASCSVTIGGKRYSNQPEETRAETTAAKTTAANATAAGTTESPKASTTVDGSAAVSTTSDKSQTDAVTIDANGAVTGLTDYYKDHGAGNLVIPSSVNGIAVRAIAPGAFQNSVYLVNVTIPGCVKEIGERAFSNCSTIKSLTIQNGVTNIGERAFESCFNLETVSIPGSVTRIENYAFFNCTVLTSVTLGNGITAIGDEAFEECLYLQTIVIPASVKSIGFCAFSSNYGRLSSVTFNDKTGWYATLTRGASSGIDMNVSDAAQNATNLKEDYASFYWYKK